MKINSLKILAIDDNADNLITIEAVIKEVLPKAEVFKAISGREGIDIARKEDPDVILLDIIMPEMDGFEVCRKIKKDRDLMMIPVLFLTAIKTNRETRIKAIEAGGEAFLTKPVDETELLVQVQSMAKIKRGNLLQLQEKERLEVLVAQRTHDLEKELLLRREVENDLVLSNQTLRENQADKLFIIECQRQLLEINDVKEAFSFVGEKVKELIDDGYVLVSNVDEEANTLGIAAYSGFEGKIEETIRIIGIDSREIKFNMEDFREEELRAFRSTTLEIMEDGIFILFNGRVSKTICNSVEKFLRTKYVHTMGFIKSKHHLGGVIILSKEETIDKKETIEIIMNHAALTINRIKLEKEKRRLEVHLNQQQRLESIGTLAGGVAHEINNPINGIMNYGQLILDSSETDNKNAEYAKEIIYESERVATIVKNLLQFSRQEKQEHSYANIKDIIEQTLSLINTIIRHDQIDLQVDITKGLPDIKCRSQQIQQVIMNLLTNARDTLNEKYPRYHEDKIIKLYCKEFNKHNRKWIRITVEDHGIGIPKSAQERVFEPFFSTKERDKGTGLGLPLSYGIVKEHHGELTFETKEGSYTRFHIDLPVEND